MGTALVVDEVSVRSRAAVESGRHRLFSLLHKCEILDTEKKVIYNSYAKNARVAYARNKE